MLTSQKMPAKVSAYIATSLDGFIAGKGGELDWLNESNAAVPRGEDCGFKAFLDSVDAIVMGRKTYETVLSFGEWPYEGKSIVVLSQRDLFSAQCAEYCHPFIGRATRSSRKAHKRRSRACVCRWWNYNSTLFCRRFGR